MASFSTPHLPSIISQNYQWELQDDGCWLLKHPGMQFIRVWG